MKKLALIGFFVLLGGVAVYSTQATENQEVKTDPLPVKTLLVNQTNTNNQVTFSGFVKGKNQTVVMPRISGYITRMNKQEGDYVQAGEILAVLEASEISAAARGSQMMIGATQKTVSATKSLFEQKVDESEEALKQVKKNRDAGDATSGDVRAAEEALKSAKRMRDAEIAGAFTGQVSAESQAIVAQGALANTVIRAPFSGIILEKQASLGNLVSPGSALYTLASPESLEVFVSLPRSYREALRKDMSVTLRREDGTESIGTITALADALGNSSQIGVRISVSPEAKNILHIGDHVEVIFTLEGTSLGIVIPEKSLLWVYDDVFVYTLKNDTAHLTPVTAGENVGDKRIITSGLENASLVVIEGQHKLHDGATITNQP